MSFKVFRLSCLTGDDPRTDSAVCILGQSGQSHRSPSVRKKIPSPHIFLIFLHHCSSPLHSHNTLVRHIGLLLLYCPFSFSIGLLPRKENEMKLSWLRFYLDKLSKNSLTGASLENIVSSIDRNPRSQNFLQYRRVSSIEPPISLILKNCDFFVFFRRKSRILRPNTHIFGSLRAPEFLPTLTFI